MEKHSLAHQVAQMLLRVGAVTLRPNQPFRYASGLLSPIYCDNRILISFPEERNQVAQWFAQTIRRASIPLDVVAGTATAGIPHAAWLAAELNLPMVYVRSKAKEHGRENLVEGQLSGDQKVVVVEDLITTGGSAMGTVTALRQAGATVEHILSIFSYDFSQAKERFAQAGVQLHPLSTLPTLLEVAVSEGYLSSGERSITQAWATDPTGWSEAREDPKQV
jgi:orotate phosphoribosyltransferase